MTVTSITLPQDYWQSVKIENDDLEFLYNNLLELETPQTPQELVRALIAERIRAEKAGIEKRQAAGGDTYFPKDHFEVGKSLSFPALNWANGTVTAIREGNNPEFPQFDVITVKMKTGEQRLFAAGIEDHILNQPIAIQTNDPSLDANLVYKTYGKQLAVQLTELLESNDDLVRIAGRWFPRSLLVDVNIGHLNLAEAVLEVANGGPLSAKAILDQVELPTDVNSKLTEFSFNLALQEDGRFDEVGPAGEVLWFLRRLEPAEVQNPPIYLRYNPVEFNLESIREPLSQLEKQVFDEFSAIENPGDESDEISINLIYPHLRVGTLPLSRQISPFFPSAYESPRVQFSFVDGNNGQRFSGWVVRSQKYAYGLRNWFEEQNLIPGSIIKILRSDKPGEVIIKAERKRPTREWIRTALIGADGGIVFAMLKQQVSTVYDERMAIAIPDEEALDTIWAQTGKTRGTLEQTIKNLMTELSKLNPQGHVHAQELYAAVNLLRRCPPGPILSMLIERPWANFLGDLYFRPTSMLLEDAP
ncbi:MAG TPA: hypothetical protein VN452_00780 [Longilinea sp.]|nr:hypothetical protein [Longilinea sp.]